MAKQARAIESRESIILAAAAIIDERNYERAGLAEIAKRAGLTTGAFYFHFTNKEELAHAVIDAQNEYSAKRASSILLDQDLPALEKSLASSADLTTSIRENQLVRAGIKLTTEVNMFENPPLLPWESWSDLSVQLFTQAIEEGDIQEGIDVRAYAEFITGSYAGIQLLSGLMTNRENLHHKILDMWNLVLVSCVRPERLSHWLERAQTLFIQPNDLPAPKQA